MQYRCKDSHLKNKVVVTDQAAAIGDPACDRIVGAAFDAFMEKGYARTSTLEIATRAKVSKRDLYASFPSKQAILLACITSRAARMRLPPDLPTPRSRQMLAATLTTFGVTVLLEVGHAQVVAMFRLAIAEAEHSPEVAKALKQSRAVNRSAIAELLSKAQAAGLLTADGNPKLMMEQFFALLWGDLMMSRLLGGVAAPKRAEAEARAQAATAALLTLYAARTGD
jgi:AcrR family transcriptional regulator